MCPGKTRHLRCAINHMIRLYNLLRSACVSVYVSPCFCNGFWLLRQNVFGILNLKNLRLQNQCLLQKFWVKLQEPAQTSWQYWFHSNYRPEAISQAEFTPKYMEAKWSLYIIPKELHPSFIPNLTCNFGPMVCSRRLKPSTTIIRLSPLSYGIFGRTATLVSSATMSSLPPWSLVMSHKT